MSNAAGLAALCAATNLLTVTEDQMAKNQIESSIPADNESPIKYKGFLYAPAFSSATTAYDFCGALSTASIPTGYTVPKLHEPAAPEPKQQPKLRMPNKKKKKGYPYSKFER